MRVATTNSAELQKDGYRLDGDYHASEGMRALRFLMQWAANSETVSHSKNISTVKETSLSYSINRLETIKQACGSGSVFRPGLFKRLFVDHPENGLPYLPANLMLRTKPRDAAQILSYKSNVDFDELALHHGMILLSCAGTIGNTLYVNETLENTVGSQDIIRIVVNNKKIKSGFAYAYLSSSIARSILVSRAYGAVVSRIEPHHVEEIPIPRLGDYLETQVHELIEEAEKLRIKAYKGEMRVQERFITDVLGIDSGDFRWAQNNEHAFAVGTTKLSMKHFRLDGFHYVGYAQEAEIYLRDPMPLGELISPYQPPIFKRPYTDDTGIPFLSGMDLYNTYPKPRLYISRRMPNLERYIVEAGTILVQNVGQRYGLFGRPTIMQKHLNGASVTQHLMRVYPNEPNDRGFVYIWLSTEIGRRLLLKQSFGTSMGVLFENSFKEMPVPNCSTELRHSFEPEVQAICDYRDRANELEDQAQEILLNELGWNEA